MWMTNAHPIRCSRTPVAIRDRQPVIPAKARSTHPLHVVAELQSAATERVARMVASEHKWATPVWVYDLVSAIPGHRTLSRRGISPSG